MHRYLSSYTTTPAPAAPGGGPHHWAGGRCGLPCSTSCSPADTLGHPAGPEPRSACESIRQMRLVDDSRSVVSESSRRLLVTLPTCTLKPMDLPACKLESILDAPRDVAVSAAADLASGQVCRLCRPAGRCDAALPARPHRRDTPAPPVAELPVSQQAARDMPSFDARPGR